VQGQQGFELFAQLLGEDELRLRVQIQQGEQAVAQPVRGFEKHRHPRSLQRGLQKGAQRHGLFGREAREAITRVQIEAAGADAPSSPRWRPAGALPAARRHERPRRCGCPDR
jgi:hypothetical protein